MNTFPARIDGWLQKALSPAAGGLILLTFFLAGARADAQDIASSWTNAVSGNWTTAADWSNSTVPNDGSGLTYAVTINANTSPYTITVNSAITIDTLALSASNATVSLTSGGTLTVLTSDTLSAGTLQLNGGTLSGGGTGSLNFGGGALAVSSNGNNTISGLAINGDITLNTSAAETQITNGTTFNTAHLDAVNATLGFGAGQTLNSTISFEGAVGGNRYVDINTGTGAFTIGASGVITTAAGLTANAYIGNGGGYGGVMLLTNNGLISSQTSGDTVTIGNSGTANTFTNGVTGTAQAINGGILTINSPNWSNAGNIKALTGSTVNLNGSWSNTGTFTVDGTSTLNLGGTFTTTGIGGLAFSTGSKVNVTGAWNNTGQTNFTLNSSTGSWTIAGGSLTGGTLNVAAGTNLLFSNNAVNLLSGVTINGDITLNATGAATQITNGATFNTAHLAGINASLGYAAGQTLNSTISFEGSAGGNRYVDINSGSGAFTIGASGVITTAAGLTASGYIGNGGGYGGVMALTNNGLISSQTSGITVAIGNSGTANTLTNGATGTAQATNGGILTINSPNWSNAGNIKALTGSTVNLNGSWSNTGTFTVDGTSTLNLGGTFTTTGIGGLAFSPGSTVNVDGAWNNTGQTTFALNSSTGSWTIKGGSLTGGTLNVAAGTNLLFNNNGANLLSGVTISGDITLNASGASTQITNGATFNTAHLAGVNASLGFAAAQTLNSTISFEGSAGGNRYVDINSGSGAFTIGASGVITTAAGLTASAYIGSGGGYGGVMLLTNNGLISSQTSGVTMGIGNSGTANTFTNAATGTAQATNGGILTINSPNWSNAGNIKALTGSTVNLNGSWSNTGTFTVDGTSTLNLGGTFTTTGIGGLAFSPGSTVNVDGAWNNTGQTTFALNSSTGSWTIKDGSLTGGTLNVVSGTNLLFNNNGANLLSGVTINGDITLSASGASAQITNGATFNTAHLAGVNASLGFAAAQTLNSTISFEGSAGGNRHVDINSGSGAFTIGASGVITTAAGLTANAYIGSGGGYGGVMLLTNNGLISSQTSGVTVGIGNSGTANTFTNAATGTAQATNGGILTVSSPNWSNAGNIKALTGSTVNLNGNWSNTGTFTVDSTSTLNLGGAFSTSGLGSFNNTGGTVNVTGALTNTGSALALNSSTGSWTMNGGTINGGSISFANGANLLFANNSSNTLNNVSVNGDLTLSANFAYGQITGGTTFNTAHLSGYYSGLAYTPGQTLNSTISFEGAGGGNHYVGLGNTAGTFAIGSTGSIVTTTGFVGSGYIGLEYGAGGAAMALTNQGLISSAVSSQSLTIQSNAFANASGGTIQAINGGILNINPTLSWTNTGTIAVGTGSTVNLEGTFNAAGGIGTFNNTGGTINLNGTITNTSDTITLNSSTGSWTMNGGTINGGAISYANGAGLLFSSSSSNTLNGVTVNGDLALSGNMSFAQITGGTTFNTAHLSGYYSGLAFSAGQTLNNSSISFEGNGGGNRYVSLGNTAGSFTVGSTGSIVTAAGFVGAAYIGPSYSFGGAAMALTNQGLISSAVSGQALSIQSNAFANAGSGTIQAINGGILNINPTLSWTNTGTIAVGAGSTVNLEGTFNAAGGIGTFNNTGGTVNVVGTIANTSNTITLNSSTGSWTMNGGTINGGAISFANAAGLLFSSSTSNTLNGVTVNGDLTLSGNMSFAQITGGTTFNTAHLSGYYSGLAVSAGQTLSNSTISFEGGGGGNRYVSLGNTAGSFTIGSTAAITTATGFVGAGYIGTAYSFGGAAMALTNQGLISSQTSGQSITINPSSFTDTGVLQAINGGNLNVTGGYTQTGANSVTRLNNGTISVGSSNTITISSGRLEGFGTITGNVSVMGVISPSLAAAPSTGILNIAGNLILGSAATMQIELGGLTKGTAYDSITESGTSQLILNGNLSISLIDGFTATSAAESFTILTSNEAITGTFKNEVNGRVTTTDGSESFNVNIVGDSVVLTAALTPIVEVTVATGTKPTAMALNPVTNQVYVANYGDGVTASTVSVIDAASDTATLVNAGVAPTAVAVNPATNKIYVANYGDGVHAGTITIIDGVSQAAASVAAGVGPQAVALDPVTNQVYVANHGASSVTAINPANNNATTTIGVGTSPAALAVNPATKMVYVANSGSSTVSVINEMTNQVVATIPVGPIGSNPVAVAVDAVTNTIYVVDQGNGTNPGAVTVINGSNNVPTTFNIGVDPVSLTVNPVTDKVYVVNFVDDTVTVIDGGTGLVTATVAVQFSPTAVAVDAATNQVYVTNSISGTVTEIDGSTNATANFQVGTSPGVLAVNPITNRIFIADKAGNDVVVRDGSKNVAAAVTVGAKPVAVANNPITNTTYVVNSQSSGTVTVIEGPGNATATVNVGNQPVAVALNPATNFVYVANQVDGTVSVIDGATNTATTLTIGGSPTAVAVNPVNNQIYVVDSADGVVAVIDGITNGITDVPVASGPTAIAVNPATNDVYVVSAVGAAGTLTVIDGATLATSTVSVGAGPTSVAVDPLTNQIFVANSQAGTVTAINGTTNTPTTVTAGAGASFVAVNPLTGQAYVANTAANTVTAIDEATLAASTIVVGNAPTQITVNPANNQIYVTNATDGTVTVIDGASSLTSTVNVGTMPEATAVNVATGLIYVANQGGGNVTVITPAIPAQSDLASVIEALPGNETFSPAVTFTLISVDTYSTPPPAEQVYFQLDTAAGPWTEATASGLTTTAPLSSLSPGLHTLYTYAADIQQAGSINGGGNASPVASPVAAYTFLVSPGGTFTFQGSSLTVRNTDSSVTVTVQRDFDAPASVQYQAVSGSAVEGINFVATQGTLSFAQGQLTQTITVPLIAQDLGEPEAFFSIQLSGPSASSFIGSPGSVGVYILNASSDDIAASQLVAVQPNAAPGAGGSVTVTLSPGAANGQWRLYGELDWRNSGDTASGLISANYDVEFKPVVGYIAPDLLVVAVTAGANATGSGTYVASATQTAGSLTVNLAPAATGGWRFQGETVFRAGGSTAPNLNPGSYIIEFQPVTGLVAPSNCEIDVQSAQLNTFNATYTIGDSPTGVTPSLVGGLSAGDPRILPATSFTGQIQTDEGFGTGFVPMDRVVVTAAHVLFNDASLTYVTGIRWFFQEDTGVFEEPPQIPRGFYTLAGYAAQRAIDNSPGVSSTASQELDAAAMYFLEPAARGGSSGYLASNSPGNSWLTNSMGAIQRDKFLAGYPVGTVPPSTIGQLYATPIVPDAFIYVTGSLFKTTALTSYPGNSGGPLFVGYNDPINGEVFYPAAIYLGGTAQTVVRAIDGQVTDLMGRAEISGNGGANNVGGGVIQVNAGITGTIAFALGGVNVILSPSDAAGKGARWGVSGGPINRQSGEAALNLSPGSYTISFGSVTGYTTPAPMQVTVKAGQSVLQTGAYTLQPAVITSRGLAEAIIGQPFKFQVTAAPNPTSFSATGLSGSGLSIDSTTGLISGTPTALGVLSITVKAANAAGMGPGSSLQLTVAMAGELTVSTTGSGSVTKGYLGSTIQAVGSSIAILATPATGYLFENWSSTDPNTGDVSVVWHHPSYLFEMPVTDIVQANFIKNPFPALVGSYNGLLGDAALDALNGRGSVSLSVTSLGAFTGSLYAGNQRYALKGAFDATGAFAGLVTGTKKQPSVALNLSLDTTGATQQVTGTASVNGVTLNLDAYLAPFTVKSPAPQALGLKTGAKYTMALPHSSTTGAPGGDGFGTVTVSPAGAVRFTGTLGDGTAVSQGTSLGKNGQWPFFTLLYSNGGALTGLLTIPSPTSTPAITGNLDWFNPGSAKALFYPAGFITNVSAQGAVLNATPLTGLSPQTLTLGGGALSSPVGPFTVTFDSKGNGTASGVTGFSMKIIPTTGLFSGQFLEGTTKVPFQGVLLPATGSTSAAGFGYFKGNSKQTGSAEF